MKEEGKFESRFMDYVSFQKMQKFVDKLLASEGSLRSELKRWTSWGYESLKEILVLLLHRGRHTRDFSDLLNELKLIENNPVQPQILTKSKSKSPRVPR